MSKASSTHTSVRTKPAAAHASEGLLSPGMRQHLKWLVPVGIGAVVIGGALAGYLVLYVFMFGKEAPQSAAQASWPDPFGIYSIGNYQSPWVSPKFDEAHKEMLATSPKP